MATLQKIVPNLWFDTQAEEAARYYVSIFRDARLGRVLRYGEEGREIHGFPEGAVMTVEFQIEGQEFVALNGGPHFQFNEAISFIVNCETQEEVDYYWEQLGSGGDEAAQMCGWLKDKFGVSWQIVPTVLNEWLQDEDVVKSQRVTQALLRMKKLDIAELRQAFEMR